MSHDQPLPDRLSTPDFRRHLAAVKSEQEEIKRDAAAIDRRVEEVQAVIAALKGAPEVMGDAVRRVWEQRVADLEERAAALTAEHDALDARSDRLLGYVTELRRRQKEGRVGPRFWYWHWGWGLLAAVTFLGFPVVSAIAFRTKNHAHMGFYEAAVQIIPVLLLAAALQGRWFEWSPDKPPLVRGYYAGALLALVAGEVGALVAVGTGHTTAVTFWLTVTALGQAGFYLAITALAGRTRATQARALDSAAPSSSGDRTLEQAAMALYAQHDSPDVVTAYAAVSHGYTRRPARR